MAMRAAKAMMNKTARIFQDKDQAEPHCKYRNICEYEYVVEKREIGLFKIILRKFLYYLRFIKPVQAANG
jgi:hypothetical protein